MSCFSSNSSVSSLLSVNVTVAALSLFSNSLQFPPNTFTSLHFPSIPSLRFPPNTSTSLHFSPLPSDSLPLIPSKFLHFPPFQDRSLSVWSAAMLSLRWCYLCTPSLLSPPRNRRGAFGWLAKSPAQVSLLFFVSAAVCLPEGDEGMPPTSAEKLAQAIVIFWLRSHFQ